MSVVSNQCIPKSGTHGKTIKTYRQMKRMIFAAAVFAAVSVQSVMAQDSESKQDKEAAMKEMISKQADGIAKQLGLSEDKTADFKTLFTEYKTKEMALRFAGMKKAAGKNIGKKQTLTDEKADSLMNAYLEREASELQLKKEYYSKFKNKIGAAAAYRVLSSRAQMRREGNNGGNSRGGNGRGGFGGGQRGVNFGGLGNYGGNDF